MIGSFEIVEYINPYFPDKQMYKCKVGVHEFHTSDYGNLVDWVYEAINNIDTSGESDRIRDKAIASFFKDSNTSKD
jgi:hypothetical protein